MFYTLYNWVVRGGIIMLPILLFSFIAVAFIIERFIYFNKMKHNSDEFLSHIRNMWKQKEINKAKELAESVPGPLAKMINSGLKAYDKNPKTVRAKIHETVLEETPKLEKYLSLIATIATIEPMLGLLGTVTGMIRAFVVIALKGTGDPQALAGGISEALITTQAGLIIAIPLLYLHNVLTNKVDSTISTMEHGAASFLSMVEEGHV